MYKLLFSISVFFLTLLFFVESTLAAPQCGAPFLVEDLLKRIDTTIGTQRVLLKQDLCSATPKDKPAPSIGEKVTYMSKSVSNAAQKQVQLTLSEFWNLDDYFSEFGSMLPTLSIPFAHTADVDHVRERLDRLWNIHKSALSRCDFDRARIIATEWGNYQKEFRMLKKAMDPLYEGHPNPYFVGYPNEKEHTENYKKFAQVGFYKHPDQKACYDTDLNLNIVGEKVSKVQEALKNAGKELADYGAKETGRIGKAWDNLGKQGKAVGDNLTALQEKFPVALPQKKTPEDIVQERTGQSLTASGLLEDIRMEDNSFDREKEKAELLRQVQLLYGSNVAVSTGLIEMELDATDKILVKAISAISTANGHLKGTCDKQAQNIPCVHP